MLVTHLFKIHKKLGAKFTGFSGWEMPLSYSGTTDEHRTVRESAGVFDIGHMGRIEIRGDGSGPLLQMITVGDVMSMPAGSAQYTLISRPSGGIIDDIIIWRGEKDRYMLCVNAANREKVIDWLMENGTRFEFEIKDITGNTGMISLQGPMSAYVLERAMSGPASSIKPWRFKEVKFGEVPCLVSMTGYTGEVGYEIIMDGVQSGKVWEILLDSGREVGIKPCGLGARDTLRLEMGYSLYGNDIDDDTTPVEAGLEWVVDFSKDDFIGKAALLEHKKNGPKRRLIFFELLQKGVPRKGFKIFSDGKEIGVVTSGNISPMLNKGIGIGYVLPEYAKPGIEVLVDIRGRVVPAIIVRRPFYSRK